MTVPGNGLPPFWSGRQKKRAESRLFTTTYVKVILNKNKQKKLEKKIRKKKFKKNFKKILKKKNSKFFLQKFWKKLKFFLNLEKNGKDFWKK